MAADNTVQETVITALSAATGAAHERRVGRFDQLAGDSAAMWGVAMTSPTVMAAQGIRHLSESGAGRTRVESNLPASSSGAGNAQTGGQA